MLVPGMSKASTSRDDRDDRLGRPDGDRRAEDVPIEHRVEVLVGRDADHDPVCDRVVGVAARVPMGDAGRQLLERHVRQAPERVDGVAVVALLELPHPAALQQRRVEVAGDRQVVAQHDRVPTLLRGPAADPVDPGTVAAAEHAVDEAVVAGQVVLGQQPDLERDLGHARQARLLRRPWILVEVPTQPVGDELVGEPLLGDLVVAVVQPPGLRLELREQGHGVICRQMVSPRICSAGRAGRHSGDLENDREATKGTPECRAPCP